MLGHSGVSGTGEGRARFWNSLLTLGETSDPKAVMNRFQYSRATFYRLVIKFRQFGAEIVREDDRMIVVNWSSIGPDVRLLARIERAGCLPSANALRRGERGKRPTEGCSQGPEFVDRG